MTEAQLPDLYAVLGVHETADTEVMRIVYRAQAKRFHPDVAGSSGLPRMTEINAAWEVLSNPARRTGYDAQRRRLVQKAPEVPSSQARERRTATEATTERQQPVPSAAERGTSRQSGGSPTRERAVNRVLPTSLALWFASALLHWLLRAASSAARSLPSQAWLVAMASLALALAAVASGVWSPAMLSAAWRLPVATALNLAEVPAAIFALLLTVDLIRWRGVQRG
jgi:hypothetical protein